MDDWELISSYSRVQAIEDGVLIDVSAVARQAGFVVPVAVTEALWHDIEAGEDVNGRLWDVLWMAYCAIRRARGGGSELRYDLILPLAGRDPHERYTVKLCSGPGDAGEHVITLMQPDEE